MFCNTFTSIKKSVCIFMCMCQRTCLDTPNSCSVLMLLQFSDPVTHMYATHRDEHVIVWVVWSRREITYCDFSTVVHDINIFKCSEHPSPLSFLHLFHLSLPHRFSWHLQRLKDKVAFCPDKGEDSSAWIWMFSHEIRTGLGVFDRQGDGSSFGGSQKSRTE